MKRLLQLAVAVIGALGGATAAYLLFTGPRMYVQPNVRPFQAEMPVIPAGAIAVTDVFKPVPSKESALKLTNPLPKTLENYARGKVYYGYYCLFCHGDKGNGYGPVGHSYVPVPADLRAAAVQSMPDGQILYSMLTGTGHTPMLQRIVPSEYWWHIVLYVRQLGSDAQTTTPAATDSSALAR